MGNAKRAIAVAATAGGLLMATAGVAAADADGYGAAVRSPGVISGNVIQVPVNVPINLCGNTVNILAAINPTFGNVCANVSTREHALLGLSDHSFGQYSSHYSRYSKRRDHREHHHHRQQHRDYDHGGDYDNGGWDGHGGK